MGRPIGEVAQAMLSAAEQPDTVRQLAARAKVAYRLGRYTASRLLERGELVVVVGSRPSIVAAKSSPGLCLLPQERPGLFAATCFEECMTEAA